MPAVPASPAALAALFAASEVRQPKDSLGFLMWQVTHAWQRHVEERLEPCGLTHLQFVVLISTAWHTHLGEPPSQATLARWTQIHPMQVSQVVKLLLAKRLLIRERMPNDGRAHRLALSAEGIERLSIAVPVVHQAHHLFFDAKGGTEAALKKLLAQLFENLAPANGTSALPAENA
jgi:DNA-binding MarR family transcriptional regulator